MSSSSNAIAMRPSQQVTTLEASSSSSSFSANLNDVLEKFRTEWKQEVQSKGHTSLSSSQAQSSDPTTSTCTDQDTSPALLSTNSHHGKRQPHDKSIPTGPLTSAGVDPVTQPSAHANVAPPSAIGSSVEAYAHAVEMERSGRLDEALLSYRRAFKLNSNADRLYHRAQLLLHDETLAANANQPNDALLMSPSVVEKIRKALDFDDHRYVAITEKQARTAQGPESSQGISQPMATSRTSIGRDVSDELTKLIGELSIHNGGERDFSQVSFVAQDEEKEIPIAKLPDELLLHILCMVAQPKGKRGAKITKPKPTPEELVASFNSSKPKPPSQTGKQSEIQKTATEKGKVASTNHPSLSPATSDSTGLLHDATATITTADPSAKSKDVNVNGSGNGSETNEGASAFTSLSKKPTGVGMVLGGADWQSVETIARTCWKFRLLTKAAPLWSLIVKQTYYPPMMDASTTFDSLAERHQNDWRNVFIHQPRVRLNGCYIAACHYARPGMSEESAWIRVIHVVEFYRSIRFLPDGTCLSLLTTDPPSETVRKLEPLLRCRGFSTGKWQLFDKGLEDDEMEGRPRGAKVVVEDLRDKSMPKYTFRMIFGLRSTTRGKWNKLDLLEYFSLNLTNGEVLPLPQKHSKPFHFSRVAQYGI